MTTGWGGAAVVSERGARARSGEASVAAPGAGPAAILGGLLWIPYGVFELLAPFGADAAYDAGRGYEVVHDRLLHFVYGLPGALALGLSAVALLGALARRSSRRRTGAARLSGWIALTGAGSALVGLIAGFDPLFTGPRVVGTLALGVGALLAARAMASHSLRRHLAVLGFAGIALLPLWPLMFAVGVIPAGAGAAAIAAFGLGWVAFGLRLGAR